MAKNLYIRDGVYYARFKVKGQEFRRSLFVSAGSKKGGEAKARIALEKLKNEIEDEIRHGITPLALWKEAIIIWSEVALSTISHNTYRRYLVSLNQCHQWLENKPIAEIDGPFLRSIVKERQSNGVTNATIKRDLTAISSVLNVAVDEGWIDVNHAYLMNCRRIPERRDTTILPTEYSISVMRKALPTVLADMMDFANETGMRQSEIVQLEWSSIATDLSEATLHKTKRKKIRTIDINLAARAILKRQPRSPLTDLVFWENEPRVIDGISSRFCAKTRKAAQEDRKFTRFRFHDLRHNFAVRYLKEAMGSIYDLQKHLGHRSIKTTEQYLDYLTPAQQRAAQAGVTQKEAQL